jgi:site-specific DNA recombinase
LIFTNKFGFQNKKVQTADINPLLLKISSINKGFDKNKKRDNPCIKNLSRLVTSTIKSSNFLDDIKQLLNS